MQEETDELIATRLQIENEREMLKLEKEKMQNELAALKMQAMEEAANQKYLAEKKEKEERAKADEEYAKKLAEAEEMTEKKIHELFHASMQQSRQIISVQDIQGNDKDEIYEKILSEKMKQSKCGRDKIERFLWHGTKNLDNLNLIIKNGFDRSYNTSSAYGKGTYFARDASYSAGGYCGVDNNGVYSILLCKVIAGSCIVGNNQINAIPKKPDGTEYDCLVDNLANPAIYVIWRDYHACPAFLVQFK